MIFARANTDDYAFEITFDATPWFEQATPQEILDLFNCEWGGDAPADAVVRFFDGKIVDVTDMLDYDRRRTVGFECYVNDDDAIDWLDQHRPGWRHGGTRGRLALFPAGARCRRCGAVSQGGVYCPNGCGRI